MCVCICFFLQYPAVICAFGLALGFESIRVCEWTVITSVLIAFPSVHAACTCTWLIKQEQEKFFLIPSFIQSKPRLLHSLFYIPYSLFPYFTEENTWIRIHKIYILALGPPFTNCHNVCNSNVTFLKAISFSVCNIYFFSMFVC
jgi:hypothetical protein